MAIEAVVFDIGNVLLEWHPEEVFDAEIGQARREVLFAATDLARMNALVDLGAPFQPLVHAWADQHPDWRDEVLLWETLWPRMASPEIAQSVRLMEALQARGVPVFSLTNFGIETYEIAAARFPFLKRFDRDFISGHMRKMKPDAAIYAELEAVSGLAGNQLIFTDDRAENIDAAAARGWHTHLFEGPEGWANRLVAEGLLTPEEVTA